MKKPPYVNTFTDRHGKARVYFRRRGYSVRLPVELGSPAFNRAYSVALSQSEQKHPLHNFAQGSVSQVIELYLGSSQYKTLSKSTRRTYRIELDKIRKQHGDKKLRDLKRSHLHRMMDKLAHSPNQANKLLRFLGMICRFAVARDIVSVDPTTGLKKLKVLGAGFKDWPESMIKKYEACWPIGTKQRLAFDLALYTGQRRSDIAKMHRNHIDGDTIQVRQRKTDAYLVIPLHPQLVSSIAATKGSGLFLLETRYAKPYTTKGFGGRFRTWALEAGIPKGYSLHGLRKACCRRLAEAGCSANEIMSISGHVTLKEAERYTRAASQKVLAQSAIQRTEQKQKTTNPRG